MFQKVYLFYKTAINKHIVHSISCIVDWAPWLFVHCFFFQGHPNGHPPGIVSKLPIFTEQHLFSDRWRPVNQRAEQFAPKPMNARTVVIVGYPNASNPFTKCTQVRDRESEIANSRCYRLFSVRIWTARSEPPRGLIFNCMWATEAFQILVDHCGAWLELSLWLKCCTGDYFSGNRIFAIVSLD